MKSVRVVRCASDEWRVGECLHVDRCRNQQPRVAFELVLAAEPRQFGAVQEDEIEKWHAEPNGDLRDRLVSTYPSHVRA